LGEEPLFILLGSNESFFVLVECEIHHKYTNVERLTSMTIDNEKLEEYYYSKLNELIATQKNVSQRYNIEYLKKNLDCTIHVEVHRGEQVSAQPVFRL